MMPRSTADFKYTVFEREGYGWYFQYGVGDGKRSSMLSVKRLVKKMGLEGEYPKLKNRKMCERIVVLAYERGFIRIKRGSKEKLADYVMD